MNTLKVSLFIDEASFNWLKVLRKDDSLFIHRDSLDYEDDSASAVRERDAFGLFLIFWLPVHKKICSGISKTGRKS